MKRAHRDTPSSLGDHVSLRLNGRTWEALANHMTGNPAKEQIGFALARSATTMDGTLFLVSHLLLPDVGDLDEQTTASVSPTQAFLRQVYGRVQQTRTTIVEFHTHPGQQRPRFSGVDQQYAYPNAKYISEKFLPPTTLVMVVGNSRFDAFDALVYDRVSRQFHEIAEIEVASRPQRSFSLCDRLSAMSSEALPMFDRQQRIPGWNQELVEKQRIGIVGAGGNGSVLWESLVSIGAGRRGFLAIADHDRIEPSNLARIPYAMPEQVGIPKVAAAATFAGRKSPATPVYPFPCRFAQGAVQECMKRATVLFHCGDSDGGRKEVNEFAIRYGIPLIDLGCDIQVSEKAVQAGGQVRLVLPGENACLACCGGFDPAQAAVDQMGSAGRAQRAAAGYVQGDAATATPSVANLNGLVAHHGLSQFLGLLHGDHFAQWEFLHFDQFTGSSITARTAQRDDCLVCGKPGYLFEGDPLLHTEQQPSDFIPLEATPSPTKRLKRRTAKRRVSLPLALKKCLRQVSRSFDPIGGL